MILAFASPLKGTRRMKTFFTGAALALPLLAIAIATPSAAANPEGRWSMSNGKVTVHVSNCGGNLCAKIVDLAEPISKIDGKPKVDRENPDPDKRKRPLKGLSILIGMKPAGEGEWKGAIYNPDDGKTYSATVRHDGKTMKVKGCVAGILCKTNTFVKVN
jgi:uncharacterized protein (DUF2147 family)